MRDQLEYKANRGRNIFKLSKRLVFKNDFRQAIEDTNQRADTVIISDSTKQIAMVELTVPTEDRIEVSTELKKARYAELEETCRRRGWRTNLWAVEVGCSGLPASSMSIFLKELGFLGRWKKTILRKLGEEAKAATRHLW